MDRYISTAGSNQPRLLPLDNIQKGGIVDHMDQQLKLVTLKQYAQKDKTSEKFVYCYDQEDKLHKNGGKIALNRRYTKLKDNGTLHDVHSHVRPSTT